MRKKVLVLGAALLVLLTLTTTASAATVVEITDDTTTSFYGYGTLADESEGLGLLKATDWYQATGGEDKALTGTFSDGEFVVGTGSEGTGAFANARVLGMYGAYDGTLTVSSATFSGNSVTSAREDSTSADGKNIVGGLVYGGKALTLDGVTFSDNTAAATGANGLVSGAVAASYAGQPVVLKGVTLTGNTASGARVQGMIAVASSDSDTSVLGTSTFGGTSAATGNTATGSLDAAQYDASGMLLRAVEGAALHAENNLYLGGKSGETGAGNAVIKFQNNTATATGSQNAAGGAVFASRNVYVETNGNKFTFMGNSATANTGEAYGGALYAGSCAADESATSYEINFGGSNNTFTFMSNSASSASDKGFGGAIAAQKMTSQGGKTIPVSITLGGSNTYSFMANSATQGGAIYAGAGLTVAGTSASFSYNSAARGGAIAAVGNASISNATFTSNSATGNGYGGAIYAVSQLAVDNATFKGNSATTLSNVTFGGSGEGNSGSIYGGAIYAANTLTVNGTSTFTQNTAPNYNGGAIYSGGALTINGSATFSGNTAKTRGGAIYAGGGLTINGESDGDTNSVVFENNATTDASAATRGGAIYTTGPTTLTNVTFTGNTATRYGGAISASGVLEINGNATFTNNKAKSGTAQTMGGAIFASGATINADVTFTNNLARIYGGAIYSSAAVTFNGDSTFTGNSVEANYGGAIYMAGGDLTFNGDTVFTNNTANAHGGAIFAKAAVNINGDATFTNNKAKVSSQSGGAIFSQSDVTFTGDNATWTFTNNKGSRGGAIFAMGNVAFSGKNVSVSFTGNQYTGADGGADIFIEKGGNLSITGTGTYLFNGGLRVYKDTTTNANGEFSAIKSGSGSLVLTTGLTAKANSIQQTEGEYFAGIYTADSHATLTGVTVTGCTVDRSAVETTSELRGGVLYGRFGVYMKNVTVVDNSVTSQGSTQGVIEAGVGNDDSWAAIASHTAKPNADMDGNKRFATTTGTVTFTGNTVTSTADRASGTLKSVPFLFLGATKDSNGMYEDAGNSTTTFSGNQVISMADSSVNAIAEGGAMMSIRGVVMLSDGNKLICDNNQAISNGIAYGGAISVTSYYPYATDGDKGVFIHGNNNTLTFTNNSATGNESYGGAIAGYRADAPMGEVAPVMEFYGNNNTYTFTNNTADTKGGAIYNDGDISFSGNNVLATFEGNEAEDGGDIYATGSVNITGNSKSQYYFNGGVYAGAASVISGASVMWNAANEYSYDIIGGLTINDHGTLVINAEHGMKGKYGPLDLTINSGLVVLNQLSDQVDFDHADSMKPHTSGDPTSDNFKLGNVYIGEDGTLNLMDADHTGAMVGNLKSETGGTIRLTGVGYTAHILDLDAGTNIVLDLDEIGDNETWTLIHSDSIVSDITFDDLQVMYVHHGNLFRAKAAVVAQTAITGDQGLILNVRALHQSEGYRTAVPEPSTWLMMVLGVFGVGYMARRRSAKKAA